MRSSGEAPKKVPSGMGMQKMVQLGSLARSRRKHHRQRQLAVELMEMRRDSTALRSAASGACMADTTRATRSR